MKISYYFIVINSIIVIYQKLDLSSNAKNDENVGIIDFKVSVQICDLNCLKCEQSGTNCIQCKSSLQFIDFEQRNCVDSCQKGQYEGIDKSLPLQKVCKKCAFNNCLECIESKCTLCIDGFYFDGIQCSKCSNECVTCSNTANSCLICSQGYYLSPFNLNQCIQCPQGCYNCITDKFCNECDYGYYLDTLNNAEQRCMPCLDYCQSCVDSISCNTCYKDIFLKNSELSKDYYDQCVFDCGSDQFSSNNKRYCIKFINSNCQNPDPKSGCANSNCIYPQYSNFKKECVENCEEGYYQGFKDSTETYKKCYKCPVGSKLCTSLTLSTECIKGYYLNINGKIQTCEKCSQNCDECKDGKSCLFCSQDYSLDGNLCVLKCSGSQYSEKQVCQDCGLDNCIQCKNSTQCSQCQSSDFELIGGLCYKKCQKGQFRDKKSYICTNCSDNCLDCTSMNKCLQCQPGYFGKKNCLKCDQSCIECFGSSLDECTACDVQKGEFLFQNQCINKCPDGFFRSSGVEECTACSDSNCKICNDGLNTCTECKVQTDFILQYESCTNVCSQGYQSYTKNNKNYCLKLQCISGYYQVEDKCKEICGDGKYFGEYQCDDGNQINGDGCNSNCEIENLFICEQGKIKNERSYCYFALDYQTLATQQANQLILTFNTNILATSDILSVLLIDILEIDQSAYSISIEGQANSNQIIVKFEFNKQVQKLLSVRISNDLTKDVNQIKITNYSKASYQLKPKSATIQINTSYIPKETQQQAAESVKTASKVFSTAIIASTAPLAMAGGITFVASIIDISQIIKLHQFLDIIYPINLQLYFKAFEGFSFPFITNFFEYLIPNDHQQNTYESFNRNNISALYLTNTGQHYTLVVFTMILHGLLKLIGMKFSKLDAFIDKTFKYAIYHEVIMSVYLEIVFFTFLQWTNMTTEITVDYINLVIMFITFFALFPLPFISAYLMKIHFNKLKEEEIKSRFGCFYDGLKEEYSCMIYFVFLHFRKIIFSFLIIFLNPYTIPQCVLLSIIPISLVIFVIQKKPFIKNTENVKQIIQEVCLATSSFLLIGLKSMDGQIEENRFKISWAIIVFLSIIVLMHFFFSMYEMYHVFLQKPTQFVFKIIIKQCKKFKNSSNQILPNPITKNKNLNQNNVMYQQKASEIISNLNYPSIHSVIKQQSSLTQLKSLQLLNSQNINSQDNLSHIEVNKQKNGIESQGFISNMASFQDLNLQKTAKLTPDNPIEEKPSETGLELITGRRMPRSHTQKLTFAKESEVKEGEMYSPSTNRINSTRISEFPSSVILYYNSFSCEGSVNNQPLMNNNFFNQESISNSPTLKKRSKFAEKPDQSINQIYQKKDTYIDKQQSNIIVEKEQQDRQSYIRQVNLRVGEINSEIQKLRQKTQISNTVKPNWK